MTIKIRENDLKKLVSLAVIDVLKNFKNSRSMKKEEISSPSLSATVFLILINRHFETLKMLLCPKRSQR